MHYSDIFIVNFEHISYIVLVFSLLPHFKKIPQIAGISSLGIFNSFSKRELFPLLKEMRLTYAKFHAQSLSQKRILDIGGKT